MLAQLLFIQVKIEMNWKSGNSKVIGLRAVNKTQEELALMYLQASANRRKQITSARIALDTLLYQGVLVPPPPGTSNARWKAMITSIENRGEPV